MKKRISLLLLLMTGSCEYAELKERALPLLALGKIAPPEAQRTLDRCCFTYTLRNYAPLSDGALSDPRIQAFWLAYCFQLWSLASADIPTPTYVSPESHADLVFQFVSPAEGTFLPDTLPAGWLAQPVTPLTSRSVRADGTVVFSLNADHLWTTEHFLHAVLYQIGAGLGLAASENPKSIMYPFMLEKPINDIDFASTQKLRELYQNPNCNTWSEQEKLPFALSEKALTVTLNEKALLLFPDASQLWEFDLHRKPAWQARKTPPPLPDLLALFSANQTAYALTTEALWEYDLAQDQWSKQPKALPFAPTPGTFGMTVPDQPDFRKEKGLIFFIEKNNGNASIKTWLYDPGAGSWTQKKPYPLGLSVTQEIVRFSAAYSGGVLVQFSDQPFSLQYNVSNDSWLVRPAFPEYRADPLTPHTWSMRDRAYALAASGRHWQYTSPVWTQIGVTPFPTSDVSFHFSLKCQGFAGMRNRKFWMYSP